MIKSWKLRYFILKKDGNFKYFESENGKEKGNINIKNSIFYINVNI
jgi:hypothetical protein